MISRNLFIAAIGALVVGCGAPQTMAMSRVTLSPDQFFITQYTNPRYHPEPAPDNNANCGPTSLAMALKAYGKVPAGFDGTSEDLIESVREALTGQRDPGSWTYPAEFPAAANHFGLSAQIVRGGADGVIQQLAMPGRMVIVNLNPSPAYAQELAIPFDGGHFALATGTDGEHVFLNDPMADGPLTLTKDQLEKALSTPLGPDIAPFHGGIAVWAAR